MLNLIRRLLRRKSQIFAPEPDYHRRANKPNPTPPLKVFDCFPAGNDTYLVVAPGLHRSQYSKLDIDIRAAHPHFEQGGFLEKARRPAVVRLQMAGGEFCGNAARSLAAWVARGYLNGREFNDLVSYDAIERLGSLKEPCLKFAIEVSGASKPLTAICQKEGDSFWVDVEMPIATRLEYSYHETEVAGRNLSIHKVELEGIVHLLVDRDSFAPPADAEMQRELFQALAAKFALQEEPALGIIWYSVAQGLLTIEPLIFVRATGSLIWETACGSGSLALALALANQAKMKTIQIQIAQPSKSTIHCTLVKDAEDGRVIEAHIAGLVQLRGEFSFG